VSCRHKATAAYENYASGVAHRLRDANFWDEGVVNVTD
jgi:hypothetical protein